MAPRVALRALLFGAASSVLASSALAQFPGREPFAGEPGAYVHEPLGALGEGSTILVESSAGVFDFVYSEDSTEVVRYRVDTNHASVLDGLLRVTEETLTGGNVLVKEGGVAWRTGTAVDAVDSPAEHAADAGTVTTLVERAVDAADTMLTLGYRETRDGKTGHKTYQFWLAGRVLKIRVTATTDDQTYVDGYTGFRLGAPDYGLEVHPSQHIPYMDSVAVQVVGTGSSAYFLAAFLDWYRSHGAVVERWDMGVNPNETLIGVRYLAQPGSLVLPLDETVNLLVTDDVTDTFPLVNHERSPYHALLSNHVLLLAGSGTPAAWNLYEQHWSRLHEWGVDHLIGWLSAWRRWNSTFLTPNLSHASPLGCIPSTSTLDFAAQETNNADCDDDQSVVTYEVIVYDPTNPMSMNELQADLEFRAMMDEADEAGYSLSLYTPSGIMDPHGAPPSALCVPNPPSYPGVSLWMPGWEGVLSGMTKKIGLQVPSQNDAYDCSLIVEQFDPVSGMTEPTEGWDTSSNIPCKSTWHGSGHPTHVVSPSHLATYHSTLLGDPQDPTSVHSRLNPKGLYVDATDHIPHDEQLDSSGAPDKAKAIWEGFRDERAFLVGHKDTYDGPLIGESSAFRNAQWESYQAGLWDGWPRRFATVYNGAPGLVTNAGSWVIPDYELNMVIPRASVPGGMGLEVNHMSSEAIEALKGGGEDAPPYDYKKNANEPWHDFLDSWWTTAVTYGHSGFFSTNGHRSTAFRTMEGMLREYYLMTAITRETRKHPGAVVRYEDGGSYLTLSDALRNGLDLKDPRVRIRYESVPGQTAVEVFANHGSADWTVDVPSQGTPVDTFTIPRNGFVVWGASGLLAFSAIPTGFGGRIDYVYDPGRWELITRRDQPGASYRSFPPPESWVQALETAAYDPLQGLDGYTMRLHGTIVRNAAQDEDDLAVLAYGGLWHPDDNYLTGSWQENGPGSDFGGVVTTTIVDPSNPTYAMSPPGPVTLSVGDRIGLNVMETKGVDARGVPTVRNFTRRFDWDSGTPAVGVVDSHGAFRALSDGTTTVTARRPMDPSVYVEITINVLAIDQPSVLGPASAQVGGIVSLSSPVAEPAGCEWDFGDSSPTSGGRQVVHTFHRPGTYTIEVESVLRSGQVLTASRDIDILDPTVSGPGILWADDFDATALERYDPAAPTAYGWAASPACAAWGLVHDATNGGNSVRAAPTCSSTIEVLGIAESLVHQRIETDLVLHSAGTAGLAILQDNPAEAPSASGYSVELSMPTGGGDGTLRLFDGATQVAQRGVPAANLTFGERQFLFLRLLPSGKLRGRLTTNIDDPGTSIEVTVEENLAAPASGTYTGLFSVGGTASFDNVRVR